MSFPQTDAVIATARQAQSDLLALLGQYQTLSQTFEGQIATLQATTTQQAQDLADTQAELAETAADRDALQKKLDTLAGNPDVIAAKKAADAARRKQLQAELAALDAQDPPG